MTAMPEPPVLQNLTAWEQEFVEAARAGAEFACSDLDAESLSQSDRPELVIRSELVREMLLGRRGPIDPRGVRAIGAKLSSELDLDHVNAVSGLSLSSCVIPAVKAEYARLPSLNLKGSKLAYLHADGLSIAGDLTLEQVAIISDHPQGALRLILAHVAGQVVCDGIEIANESGPGAVIDRLYVDADLFLRGGKVSGNGPNSALRMATAKIGGQITLDGSTFSNGTGPAFVLDGAEVGGNFYIQNAHMKGAERFGALRMLNAKFAEQIILNKCVIVNESGPALNADGLHAAVDLIIHACEILGDDEDGALRIPGGKIGRQLEIEGLRAINRLGPAVHAEALSVGGSLNIKSGEFRGFGKNGAFRLSGAHIGHRLILNSLQVYGAEGPAFQAEGIEIEANLSVTEAVFVAACDSGTIRLSGAAVRKQIDFESVQIANARGTAFHADGLKVGANFRMSMTAAGGVGTPTIRLPGAKINGQLSCIGLTLAGSSNLLELEGLSVGSTLFFPLRIVCSGFTADGECDREHFVNLDECTYSSLGRVEWEEWLHIIERHSHSYQAQPYQQLAAAERADGHDNYANRVLIAQQRDRRNRAKGAFNGKGARFAHDAYGLIAGYGYLTSRLVGLMIAVLILAGSIGYIAGQVGTRPGHRVAERTSQVAGAVASAGVPCSSIELIGLGLDRGLPLGSLGFRSKCDLDTSTRRGTLFTSLLLLIQGLLWLIVTLVIAGYTGLVRKLR